MINKIRYVTYNTLPVVNIHPREVAGVTKSPETNVSGTKPTFLGKVRREFLNQPTPTGAIFHGRTFKEVPKKKIKEISSEHVSAFCAPPSCLDITHQCLKQSEESKDASQIQLIKGIQSWDQNEDFAYGMATSLYEKLSTGQYAGDPVADSLSIVTRRNSAILALADGVSWGQKSKLASNCSVYGSIMYLCEHIDFCSNTEEVFRCILRAFENAQKIIIEEHATLTTLCVAVIVQLQDKDKWGLCVVNVGDSYAYIYNKMYGVKEVTHGSHPIDEPRDMRYSGGALGPADGFNPDLSNMTCSFVSLEEGDIVFLCSDGISDNFDPVIAKFIPRFKVATVGMSKNNDIKLSPNELMKNEKSVNTPIKTRELNITSNRQKSNKCEFFHDVASANPDNILQAISVDNHSCDNLSLSSGNVTCFRENPYPDFIKRDTHIREMTSNNELKNNDNVKCENVKCAIADIDSRVNDGSRQIKHLVSETISSSFPLSSIIEENCNEEVMGTDLSLASVEEVEAKEEVVLGISLTPRERQDGALEQMKEVINTVEFEPINQGSKLRAVDICAQLMNFVINRTAEKRDILELLSQSEINLLSSEERKYCNRKVKEQLKDVPGKLDHASIVAYEVGIHGKSALTIDLEKSSNDSFQLITDKRDEKLDLPRRASAPVTNANAIFGHVYSQVI